MLTLHILNVYVDETQPRQFKFTFKTHRNYCADPTGSHVSARVIVS